MRFRTRSLQVFNLRPRCIIRRINGIRERRRIDTENRYYTRTSSAYRRRNEPAGEHVDCSSTIGLWTTLERNEYAGRKVRAICDTSAPRSAGITTRQ